jgi:hypothetical protein
MLGGRADFLEGFSGLLESFLLCPDPPFLLHCASLSLSLSLGLGLSLELSVSLPALKFSFFPFAIELLLRGTPRLLFFLARAGGGVGRVCEAEACRRGLGSLVRGALLRARLARVGALLNGAHGSLRDGIFASTLNALDGASRILLGVLGVGDVVSLPGHGDSVMRRESERRWSA